MKILLFAALLFPGGLSAANAKSDAAALREQLTQAQAQIAQQNEAIARLSAANKERAQTAARQNLTVRDAQNANAGKAQVAVSDARNANDQAVIAATVAKAQTDVLLRVSDRNATSSYATLITTLGTSFTLIAGLLWKDYTERRNRKWEMEDTAAHRKLELDKIAEGIEASRLALVAANDVNQKILTVGLRAADGTLLKPESGL